MENKFGDYLTVKPKPKILWIDDDANRKKQASNLSNETGLVVEFFSLRGKDVLEQIHEMKGKYIPKLIIIDHVLNNTKSTDLLKSGSTLVGFFRESWAGCPVFGVTAAQNLKKIDIERYAYDELIDLTNFSSYIQFIPNVIEGFKKCKKVKTIDGWISLLKPPKNERERINACLPHDVKTDVQKIGFASRVYRWFSRKLYGMPGFLYDKDWVATFIGVKKREVEKYLKFFDNAKYQGIFNNPDIHRWWKAKLYEDIYGKSKDANAFHRSTQDVANDVLKVPSKDQSVCYVCGKKWPDTVAFVDKSDNASVKQMHLKCTVAHPMYRYEPMFEELRIMRED